MATARQKEFYTKQRQTAEERADEGDTRARDTVSKIYGKLGRKDREYTDTGKYDKVALDVATSLGGPGKLLKGAVKGGMRMAEKLGAKAESKALTTTTRKALTGGKSSPRTEQGPKIDHYEASGKARPMPGRSGPQKALSGGKMKNVTPKSPKPRAPRKKAPK